MTTNIETNGALNGHNNWEIAVACDIRLSSLFSDSSDPYSAGGSIVDIDPLAISSILQGMDSESSGTILLTAMHNDSMSKPSYMTEIDGSTEHVGINKSHIKAVVAKEVKKTINRHEYRQVMLHEPISLQKTIVHELSHALDNDDQTMLHAVMKHRIKHDLINMAFQLTAAYAGGLIVDEATKRIPNTIIDYGLVALGALAGGLSFRHVAGKRLSFKEYLSRPNEVKATAQEVHALNYPQVITIYPNTHTKPNVLRT